MQWKVQRIVLTSPTCGRTCAPPASSAAAGAWRAISAMTLRSGRLARRAAAPPRASAARCVKARDMVLVRAGSLSGRARQLCCGTFSCVVRGALSLCSASGTSSRRFLSRRTVTLPRARWPASCTSSVRQDLVCVRVRVCVCVSLSLSLSHTHTHTHTHTQCDCVCDCDCDCDCDCGCECVCVCVCLSVCVHAHACTRIVVNKLRACMHAIRPVR